MPIEYRLAELAERVRGQVRGDPERLIRGIDTLDRAGPDQLSFLTNPRYREAARSSRAGALLVPPGTELDRPDLIETAEPYAALARLLELFHPPEPARSGVSEKAHIGAEVQIGQEVFVGPFAVIGDRAVLADRASVGAGCVVGDDCRIGEDSRLMPRVVLYSRTRVGRRCVVHSGVVLGGDGFGFATSGGEHRKVPQLGRVVIEDDVELGSNSTVDRGTLGETSIGEGSKIDNLVMIAHGVRLGRGSLLAAQVGIAGSTRVGDGTVWAGQSGAAGHLTIADGTIVAAKAAVLKDVKNKEFVAGIPAVDHRRWKRAQALVNKLPEMRREIRELKARLAKLEQNLSHEED